jgi:hypothetical protein
LSLIMYVSLLLFCSSNALLVDTIFASPPKNILKSCPALLYLFYPVCMTLLSGTMGKS